MNAPKSPLEVKKQSLRKMTRPAFTELNAKELAKVNGGYSQRCPNCALSSCVTFSPD